jgi:hypothetical protein
MLPLVATSVILAGLLAVCPEHMAAGEHVGDTLPDE